MGKNRESVAFISEIVPELLCILDNLGSILETPPIFDSDNSWAWTLAYLPTERDLASRSIDTDLSSYWLVKFYLSSMISKQLFGFLRFNRANGAGLMFHAPTYRPGLTGIKSTLIFSYVWDAALERFLVLILFFVSAQHLQ